MKKKFTDFLFHKKRLKLYKSAFNLMLLMKKNLSFLLLSLLPLSAYSSQRFQAYTDAVYLRFYETCDSSRISQSQVIGSNTIDFHEQKIDPTFGLSAGFIYNSPFARTQMKLSGLFFQTTGRDRSHYYPGIVVDGFGDFLEASSTFVQLNAALYQPYYGFNGANQPPFQSEGIGLVVDTNNKLYFNQIDLTFAPTFCLNKVIDLLPVWGISSLISDYKNNMMTYVQDSAGLINDYLALSYENTLKNSNKGIGPNIGVGLHVRLTKFLDFDILGLGRFMWANQKASVKTCFDVAEITPFDPEIKPTDVILHQNRHAVQANYTFYANLNAKIPVKKTMQFGLTLGYRLEYLPNYFTVMNRFHSTGESIATQTLDGIDLSMQGLTAGAFINF